MSPIPSLRAVLAICCALAAADGVAGTGYLDAHERVLSAPDCVDARNIIAELAEAPSNTTFVRVQHVGDPRTPELVGEIARVVTWNVGAMTGLAVAPADFPHAQRGWRDAGPPDPASAYQLWCNGAGFVLNSRQFSHKVPIALAGPNVSVARDLDPPVSVFRNWTSALTIAGGVSIPWVQWQGAPVIEGTAQVSFFYYALDTTTGTRFVHVIALFDNRAFGANGTGEEAMGADAHTVFVTSPLRATTAGGEPTRYVVPSPTSSVAEFGNGWAERRRFRAHVTYERFKELVTDLRDQSLPGISVRPEDYVVTEFGLLGEIFPGTETGHEVGLAASVQDLALSEAFYDVAPVDVIEFYDRELDHYFMSIAADEIDALDRGRVPGWERTGASFRAYPGYVSGALPACRFYLPPDFGDSHFFSVLPSECSTVAAKFPAFVLESAESFYLELPDTTTGACSAGRVAVYRLWNGRAATNHRYVVDRALRDAMRAAGWVAEGYGPESVALCAPQ